MDEWEEIPYGSDEWCYWVALALAQHNHVMNMLVTWVAELREKQDKVQELALALSTVVREILTQMEAAGAADKSAPGISMYQ